MIKRFSSVLLFAATSFCCTCLRADEYSSESGEDRLLKYVTEMLLLEESYGFTVREILSDGNETLSHKVARVLIHHKNGVPFRRYDIYSVIFDQGSECFDHLLRNESGTWVGLSIDRAGGNIKKTSNEGKKPSFIDPGGCNPFAVPIGVGRSYRGSFDDALGFPLGQGEYSYIAKRETLNATTDRFEVLGVFSSNRDASLISFGTSPGWLPLEVVSVGPDPQDFRFDAETITADEALAFLKGGRVLSNIRFEWTQLKSGKWVPKQMNFEKAISNQTDRVVEFCDWQFGDELDLRLFDEANFNQTEIEKYVKFAEWEESFSRK